MFENLLTDSCCEVLPSQGLSVLLSLSEQGTREAADYLSSYWGWEGRCACWDRGGNGCLFSRVHHPYKRVNSYASDPLHSQARDLHFKAPE